MSIRWRFPVLYPFKLLAYFTHETFRCAAVAFTCGKVESIDIHPEEGSETTFTGGCSSFVHLLGYFGTLALGIAYMISSISFIPSLVSAAVIAMLLIGFAVVSKTQYMRVINLMSIMTVLAIVLASYLIHIHFVLQLLVLFCGVIHILFFFVDASDKYRIHASDYVTFEDKYGFPAVVAGGLIVALSYLVVVGLDMTLMSHDSQLLPSIYVMSTWSKCSCIIMLFSVVILFLTALVKCFNCITSQHAYTRV
ncbi:hypothetical protein AeRB84_010157 [Aphanomyces euteiches]|nr:hypothetical protein AeRB84_010157 [Aphanomyces euteiches]